MRYVNRLNLPTSLYGLLNIIISTTLDDAYGRAIIRRLISLLSLMPFFYVITKDWETQYVDGGANVRLSNLLISNSCFNRRARDEFYTSLKSTAKKLRQNTACHKRVYRSRFREMTRNVAVADR